MPMELDESRDDLRDDADVNSPVSRAHVREHGSKVVELARRHGFGEFASHRAENRVYEDEQIPDLFSDACLTQGSTHSEGEAGWFLDENDVCDDSTFLRVIKQFATPENEEAPASVQELEIEDIVVFTELYREELMKAFETATENILTTIRHEDPFDDRHVVAAVDFTHVPYHVWPWIDKDEQTPKAEYPPMVSGYKDDGEIKHGYTFLLSWGSNQSRSVRKGNRKLRRPIRRERSSTYCWAVSSSTSTSTRSFWTEASTVTRCTRGSTIGGWCTRRRFRSTRTITRRSSRSRVERVSTPPSSTKYRSLSTANATTQRNFCTFQRQTKMRKETMQCS